MQIGGTARQSQLPAFVASCDYLILGDEMFAANAYVTQDEQQISNIAGQDIVRIIVLLIMILGSLASLAGIDVIANFLSI
jgi:hypothetical protein